MPFDVCIERMRIDEMDAVLSFLTKAYEEEPRQSEPGFWKWHFLELPGVDAKAPPVWLAKIDDRIVGQMAALPVMIDAGEKAIDAAWAVDLIVDAEFRRLGIAKMLTASLEAEFPFVLAASTTRQHSTELFLGRGWKMIATVPRFRKMIFAGNASRDLASVAPVRAAANALSRPFRHVPKQRHELEIRRVDSFDPDFDELWRDARRSWKFCVRRSSEYLDWQFRRQPGKSFEIFGCYSSGRLRGYAVLFFRKPVLNGIVAKGAITDICYGQDDAENVVDALVGVAVGRAIELRVGSLVADALDPLLEKRLKRFGFWHVKGPLRFLAKIPREYKAAAEAMNWFLTRADADISIFEEPNRDVSE